MARFSLAQLEQLATQVMLHAGTSPAAAEATARALAYADARGLGSHGVARLPMYTAHIRHGRVDPDAQPAIVADRGAAVLIDAKEGMAFPACALAVDAVLARARQFGTAVASVTRSHHFGVAAYHLEALGAAGLVGLAFSNSPAAMPAWNGRRSLFGTNPIAAVFPRRAAPPLLIDLSLSEVARGKIMLAAKEGKPIPAGWALDKDGQPTTDAKAALEGMMLPAGGAKGAMLALMVELFVVALGGAQFGYEADSFFTDAGNRPQLGQLFWAVDPAALAGNDAYTGRVEALVEAMLADPGVRLPGARRQALAVRAAAEGIEIADALAAQLQALAG